MGKTRDIKIICAITQFSPKFSPLSPFLKNLLPRFPANLQLCRRFAPIFQPRIFPFPAATELPYWEGYCIKTQKGAQNTLQVFSQLGQLNLLWWWPTKKQCHMQAKIVVPRALAYDKTFTVCLVLDILIVISIIME
jgi:hypothetical protein